MEHSTIANIFLKIADMIVGQYSKYRDRKIVLDQAEVDRIAGYMERIANILSTAAESFERGKIPFEQCMELEMSVKSAASVASELSRRISEDVTARLMDLLMGGVNAPGALSEIVEEHQRRALLWYFQSPGKEETAPVFDNELKLLREAAGAYRGAATLVRLGVSTSTPK